MSTRRILMKILVPPNYWFCVKWSHCVTNIYKVFYSINTNFLDFRVSVYSTKTTTKIAKRWSGERNVGGKWVLEMVGKYLKLNLKKTHLKIIFIHSHWKMFSSICNLLSENPLSNTSSTSKFQKFKFRHFLTIFCPVFMYFPKFFYRLQLSIFIKGIDQHNRVNNICVNKCPVCESMFFFSCSEF